MTRRRRWLISAFATLAIGACAAPEKTVPAVSDPVASESWRFHSAAADLRKRSCPRGTAIEEPRSLDLHVTPVSLGPDELLAGRLPVAARLTGAWQLASADRNLGGLSGLAIVPGEDRLLAVSDAGALVSIPLTGGVPSGDASIIYLRAADGRFLAGKLENDAEGLVYRDGMALVSFERRFRIEAFAIGTCGAAARAARIADLPAVYRDKAVSENAGPEALWLAPDGTLGFGYETAGDGSSPLGSIAVDGTAVWLGDAVGKPAGFALVGLDEVVASDGNVTRFTLFRSFDPIRGVRSVLSWGEKQTEQIVLSRPLLTDNFEGIAAESLPEGGFRVWIVSDDNFSNSQKTLLYAFEIDPAR